MRAEILPETSGTALRYHGRGFSRSLDVTSLLRRSFSTGTALRRRSSKMLSADWLTLILKPSLATVVCDLNVTGTNSLLKGLNQYLSHRYTNNSIQETQL